MSNDIHFSKSPYPGLRPFEAEESDIFFGREKQSDEILARLQRHHFLAIIGPSGCGKSSLVRAGMIAALKTGFMCDAGPDWRILQMRPGEKPLARVAAGLLELASLSNGGEVRDGAQFLTETALRRGPLSLVELVRESGLCVDTNLLLLVDQFEELFRFREKVDPDEADAFASLLLATAAQRQLPISVVITMRSDFLGDCALFQGLPEAINESQYLTPRLTREQCAEAICGPARVFGGEVNKALLNRLLNDFGPDPDQLPLLQHALMRMWQLHCNAEIASSAADHIELTLDDYELIGGLQYALSNHADETLAELSTEQQRIAQVLFRRLTERGVGHSDTRSPARLEEVAAIANVAMRDVEPVVNAFRRSDRSFLTPREDDRLEADSLLDIGHESLIRQWKTLSEWVDDEAESAKVYSHLRDTSRLWKKGEAALWGTPDLERALAWKTKANPTETWALQYGSPSEFQVALEFLNASEQQQNRLQEKARQATKRKVRHAYIAAGGFALVALVLLSVVLLNRYFYVWPHSAFYNSYAKRWGVPTGIGALSVDQVKRRLSSVQIVREGSRGKVLKMEVVDRRGELTRQHGIGTYLETSDMGQSLPSEVRWEYTYDGTGEVLQENAYDERGNRVWAFVYLPKSENGKVSRTGYYVGRDGYPRSESKYAGNVVEIKYDDRGFEEIRRYRSRGRKGVRGPDKAFGQKRLHDDQGNTTSLISLGPDDQPLNDAFGNAMLVTTRLDSLGNQEEVVARDASGNVTITKPGWAIRRSSFDSAGNSLEESYFDPAGKLVSSTDGYHRVTWARDAYGNPVEERYWDTQRSPTPKKTDGCYGSANEFDERDNPVKRVCLGADSQSVFSKDGYAIWVGRHDAQRNLLESSYFDPTGQPVLFSSGYFKVSYRYHDNLNKLLEIAYFLTDGSPALSDEGCARITREYDEFGRLRKEDYFGVDGKPISITKGYAALKYEYDAFGNQVKAQYFGEDGKPAIGSELGVAGWSARFDAGGREIERRYFDIDEKPTFSNKEIAGMRSEYDAAGNKTKYSYIGLHQELIVSDGIAGWTSEFSVLGNETKRKYFNDAGQPAELKAGYAGFSYLYDHRGNQRELSYYDKEEKLVLVPWNEKDTNKSSPRRARENYKYDPQNHLIEEAYFDKDGKSVANSRGEGWARATHKYDPRGNRIETKYFGVDDQPVLQAKGYHSVRRIYDNLGNNGETQYFSIDGNPILSIEKLARIVRRYDRFGRIVEQMAFDHQNEPAVTDRDVHKNTFRYDWRGQKTEVAYFGLDGAPVLARDGYHAIQSSYDNKGKLSKELFLGTDGKAVFIKGQHPMLGRYAGLTYSYNSRGLLERLCSLDNEGLNVQCIMHIYDAKGRLIDRTLIGSPK